jgi:hypothetical protein
MPPNGEFTDEAQGRVEFRLEAMRGDEQRDEQGCGEDGSGCGGSVAGVGFGHGSRPLAEHVRQTVMCREAGIVVRDQS